MRTVLALIGVCATLLLVVCNQSTDPSDDGGAGTTTASVQVRVYPCQVVGSSCTPSATNCACPNFRGSTCELIEQAALGSSNQPIGKYFVCDHKGHPLDSAQMGVHIWVDVPSGSTVAVKMLTKTPSGTIDTITDAITAVDSLRWDFFRNTYSLTGPPTPCDTAKPW